MWHIVFIPLGGVDVSNKFKVDHKAVSIFIILSQREKVKTFKTKEFYFGLTHGPLKDPSPF